MTGRDAGPGSPPGPDAKTGLTNRTQHYPSKAAQLYRDEVHGRLVAVGAALVLAYRGDIEPGETEELVKELVVKASQWFEVYEAERRLAS